MHVFGYGVFFLLGNLLILSSWQLPHPMVMVSLALLCLPLLLLRRLRYCYLFFFLSFICSYGYAWCWQMNSELITVAYPQRVEGVVDDLVSVRKNQYSNQDEYIFSLSLRTIDGKKLYWWMGYPRIKALLPFSHSPVSGDTITALVSFKAPSFRRNAGAIDLERISFARGFIGKATIEELYESSRSSYLGIIDKLRQSFSLFVSQHSSEDVAGIISALTVGDSRSISDEQWNIFTLSGTIHLISISGSHLTLICMIIYHMIFRIIALFPTLRSGNHVKHITSFITACLITVYSFVAGFSIPVFRALILILIYIVFNLEKRSCSLLPTVLIVLVTIVLCIPTALLLAGTWLSISAFALIVALAPLMQRMHIFFRVIYIQFLLIVLLSPLTVIFFSSLSLLGSMMNVIAVPLVEIVIMPLSLIYFFWWLILDGSASYLYTLIELFTRLLLFILALVPEHDFVYLLLPRAEIIHIVLLSLLALAALLPIDSLYMLRVAVGYIIVIWSLQQTSITSLAKMTLFDVGHGLSFLFQTKHHALLYDTGGLRFKTSVAKITVLPYMKRHGVDVLDMVISSHGDSDHSAGLSFLDDRSLSNSYLVSDSYTKDTFLPNADNTEFCAGHPNWSWDEVTFQIIHPQSYGGYRGDNDSSCILLITTQSATILLMGDASIRTEIAILDMMPDLKADILIVGHHGSRTSTHQSFVERIGVDSALISSSGKYGFPHEAVLHVFSRTNTSFMNTGWCGMIEGEITTGGYIFNCVASNRFNQFNSSAKQFNGMSYEILYNIK